MKIALRNILVQPTRSMMSVIGVMGCVSLLVCAFGIRDTVNNSIDNEVDVQFIYDIRTTYTDSAESDVETYLDSIGADYESFESGIITVRSDTEEVLNIYLLKPESTHSTIQVDGEILMSRSKAEVLGVSEGDTITLSSTSATVEVTINRLIDTSVTQGIFMSEATYDSLGLGLHLTNHMWITVVNANQDMVDQLNEINGTNGAWLKSYFYNLVQDSMSSMNTIQNTMVIFSLLLSVIVLYNFALLNITDRIRDIATLKVLGLNNKMIGRMLIYEMMILVIIGTGFGLLLGYPILELVLNSNKVDVIAYMFHIRAISYVNATLISIATAFIFNLAFSISIKKINMIESLKSIE